MNNEIQIPRGYELNAPATYPAPNELQLLLEDDALAISCQTIAQYRAQLTNRLRDLFAGAPALPQGQHTPGRITAPVTPNGRAYGLIPEGKGWADDLINWSTREFRNPADAVRLEACWNACVHIPTDELIQPMTYVLPVRRSAT